jgi:hypothetical protein
MSCITILNPNPRENPFAAAQENKKRERIWSVHLGIIENNDNF